jgi:hypothetical protein
VAPKALPETISSIKNIMQKLRDDDQKNYWAKIT